MLADRRGRQTTNVQGYVTTIRSFNDQGLPLSESYSGGPLANLSVTNQFLRRTNVSLLNSSTPKLTNSAAFDAASRLQLLTDGSNSAYCGYVANSMLLSQIAFANGSAQRMVTTETYDFLNRLTSISSVPSASSVVSFSYLYNSANQRTRMTMADGTYWLFGYDSLGQITSGKKYWSDGATVAGEQFEYGFDDIGNRTATRNGGDQFGYNLRPANYGANPLNQYTNRTVPRYLNVLGTANSNATVSLWTPDGYWAQTTRHLDFFRGELAVNNSTGSLGLTITKLAVLPNGTNSDFVSNFVGNCFLPQTPEQFGYDADGKGQTAPQARTQANAWVRQNMLGAQANFCRCGPMDDVAAAWYFGLALHTVQDSTSPAHNGFQVWHGLAVQWTPAAIIHVKREVWDPGPGSNLDTATAWLWSFMQCPAPQLPADFFPFKRDWSWFYDGGL